MALLIHKFKRKENVSISKKYALQFVSVDLYRKSKTMLLNPSYTSWLFSFYTCGITMLKSYKLQQEIILQKKGTRASHENRHHRRFNNGIAKDREWNWIFLSNGIWIFFYYFPQTVCHANEGHLINFIKTSTESEK